MSEESATPGWVPLSAPERRVLGVLIEKQKTTPDNYPMTLNALVAGCNQKSNRDPVTSYDSDEVEDTLHSLRQKGAALLVDAGGRVLRWKHAAYEWLGLKGRPVEMAVLAELLLRGPQTEGELRQHASRMDTIADLPALQTILGYLNELGLVHYLSPQGQKRGVMVAHGLYPPDELERIREAARHGASETAAVLAESAAQPTRPAWADESAELRAQIESLRASLSQLADEVRQLKSALGA
jgi:hypothetical protein